MFLFNDFLIKYAEMPLIPYFFGTMVFLGSVLFIRLIFTRGNTI